MAHYEIHQLHDHRWVLDGVFDDRAAALAEARGRLARARNLLDLRVLRVSQERDSFVETIIFSASTAEGVEGSAVRRRRRHLGQAGWWLGGTVAGRAREIAAEPLFRPSALAFFILLILWAALIWFSEHAPPRQISPFDRPEAQIAHPIRNPLRGAD
jgi:hypothetical protein